MRTFTTLDDVAGAAGQEVGTSEWLTVDQEQVDLFADATDDHQWIHVDAERAAEGPFGGTIAHGFLTLSLLPHFASEVFASRRPAPGSTTGWRRCGSPHRSRSGAGSART